MTEELTKKFEALAADVAALKVEVAALKGAGAAPAKKEVRLLSDEQLAQPWADKEVRKDPKNWPADNSYVGKKYSECPANYLGKLAGAFEWKAAREKEEPEPKKKNNGKFWYESTEFEARIIRSWEAKKKSQPAALPGDDSLPF